MSSFAAAAIPLLGPLLTQRWDVAPETIGYVSAVVSTGICWFLACGGPMLDHHGPVRSLQIGLLFVAVGLVLLSQPFGLVGLLGALVVGLGLAPNTPAGSQVLMRTAPVSHRTLVFSIKQAGVPMGGAVAGLTVAPLVLWLGFVGAMWALAILVLLSAVLVQPFQKKLDAEKGPQNRGWPRLFLSPSSLSRAVRVLNAHPSLPMLTAIGVSFSITQASITAFTATYMVTQHGRRSPRPGIMLRFCLQPVRSRESSLAGSRIEWAEGFSSCRFSHWGRAPRSCCLSAQRARARGLCTVAWRWWARHPWDGTAFTWQNWRGYRRRP